MDFAAAGLLEGLDGPDRQARLELLERLEADGATLVELTQAVRENRLPLLLVERRLGGRYTAKEVEEATGVPAEILIRLRRLLGLPEPGENDRVFGDDDVQQAQSTKLFLEAGFSVEALAELSRVLGESMARLAASVSAQFAETFLRAGDSEHDVAERFDTLAEQLTPALAPVLVSAFNAHLRESVHRAMISPADREAGRVGFAQDLCVCFADLVGFTRLGGELEVQELGTVAGQLAGLAGDVALPPVRLIKTLGDAVMYVSPEAEPLIAVALKLVDAAEEADLPSLRAGIACGLAVQRTGDFFGHSVNLASRVTGVARPDSVLCTQAVRDQALEAFDWSYAGRFRLKGVAEAEPLYRPHWVQAASDDPDGATEASSSSKRAGRRRRSASR